jgi:molybdopterin converting factor subunit 1
MMLEVLLFARLREVCGQRQMRIELAVGATVADCFAHLAESFPELRGSRESVVVAINEEYATWTDQPADGDTVAFIPPVSGG